MLPIYCPERARRGGWSKPSPNPVPGRGRGHVSERPLWLEAEGRGPEGTELRTEGRKPGSCKHPPHPALAFGCTLIRAQV